MQTGAVRAALAPSSAADLRPCMHACVCAQVSHVVLGLRTAKGAKQLKLDPTIYDALQKEKVQVRAHGWNTTTCRTPLLAPALGPSTRLRSVCRANVHTWAACADLQPCDPTLPVTLSVSQSLPFVLPRSPCHLRVRVCRRRAM